MALTTDDYLIIVRIVSFVTLGFSLSVVVTILYFEEMRKKLFFKCILMISVADMGTAIISSFGFLESGPLCTFQGVTAIFFPVASWCWTTILSYSIYSIIRYERVVVNMYACQLFCWGLPALCGLLPLTTSRYGPANINLQWCIILARDDSPTFAEQFWVFSAFFGWYILFVVLMLSWTLIIFYRLIWQQTVATQVVSRIYNKLWLYPVAVFISWGINFVVIEFSNQSSSTLVFLSMVFGICSGIWSTLIFFIKSSEARARWYEVIYPSAKCVDEETVLEDGRMIGSIIRRGNSTTTGNVGGGSNTRSNTNLTSNWTTTGRNTTASRTTRTTDMSSRPTDGGGFGIGRATTNSSLSGSSMNSTYKHNSNMRRSELQRALTAGNNARNLNRLSRFSNIVEDFDVDDDGEGKALVYYEEDDLISTVTGDTLQTPTPQNNSSLNSTSQNPIISSASSINQSNSNISSSNFGIAPTPSTLTTNASKHPSASVDGLELRSSLFEVDLSPEDNA